VKLSSNAEIIIANGAECEPLTGSDRAVMTGQAHQVVRGLELSREAVGADRLIIGVKRKNKDAVSAMKTATEGTDIEIHLLEDVYPAGDEHVLVYEATGRVAPEGGIPLDVNVIVMNVNTLYNVAWAYDGHPVTRRFVTVSGEVKNPMTAVVPIGTTLKDVIEMAGGANTDKISVVVGGPMMGDVTDDLQRPIDKRTSGVLVLPSDHNLIRERTLSAHVLLKRTASVCIQCRACTDICPRYLLGHKLYPHLIMRVTNHMLFDPKDVIASSYLCTGCGLCQLYACPMYCTPTATLLRYKQELAQQKAKTPGAEKNPQPRPIREMRKIPLDRIIQRLGLSRYDVDIPVVDAALSPGAVRIALLQHTGEPAIPVVEERDKVQEGDLIGEIPAGKLGAAVHASITGTIRSVTTSMIEIDGKH
jgi:Na+-translocating ferredoxin:NAD+ oxidoreductase RnfC subunit